MANRQFEQFRYSLEKKVVDLFLKVSFGAAGAPTMDAKTRKGFKSITRTGAGTYAVVLQDNYHRLLGFSHGYVSGAAPAAPGVRLSAENVAAGALTLVFSAAGVATDPAAGEAVHLHLSLSNTSAL